jgi:signal transduction histidine kinase
MGQSLDLLLVEDSENDAELLIREIRRGGYDPAFERVDTAEALTAALNRKIWQLVIADYTMPRFSGTDALAMVRSRGLDIPFIFVSATIGEDIAVAAMRAGAQDYLVKGQLKRLVPAIQRELREAEVRRERRSAEEQLHRAQRMEAIGQLTGGLAHDFNNLLAIIVGNLDMILEEFELPPPAKRLADAALRAGLRGADLTRHLLAFARRQSLEARVFDVNELVRGMAELLRRTLGEQIDMRMVLAEDLPPVLADAAQLESACLNLAINARDAMPNGGKLVIETENVVLDGEYTARNADVTPGSYVALAVSDSGTGIPSDILDKVFEPFFTTKTGERGTGLGLSMVYGFAKQTGGHVRIYSEVGHGTTVRLYLPVARSGDRPSIEEAPEELPAPALPAVVLVVEDNPDVRSVTVAQLSSLGYSPIEADSAAAALAILESSQPVDLLFTDIIMPGGMSGIDLAAAAEKIRPGLKVLYASGFPGASMEDRFAAIRNALLIKPFRRTDLGRKIRDIMADVRK